MIDWANLPYDVKYAIVHATIIALARDCESIQWNWDDCSPAKELGAFRSLLLVNREIFHLVKQTTVAGVKAPLYFQTRQREMIFNIIKYMRQIGDFPCPFLDFRDAERVAGCFWKNALVYRDFDLVSVFFIAVSPDLVPRLLCLMGEFLEMHLETSEISIAMKTFVDPSLHTETQCSLIMATGPRQILWDDYRSVKSLSAIDFIPSTYLDNHTEFTAEFLQMKKILSAWFLVESNENGEFPDDWHLVNYQEQVVFDHRLFGFERDEGLQESIDRFRIDQSNL